MKKPIISNLLGLLLAIICASTDSLGGTTPFNRSVVDEQARWVLHLDLIRFRGAEIGRHMQQSWTGNAGQSNDSFRIKYWEAAALVENITAYGVDLGRNSETPGVLVAQTKPGVSDIIEALLIQQETSGQHVSVEIVQDHPYPLYRVGSDTFLAVHSPEWIVVSKSREQIEIAREVLEAKRAHDAEDFTQETFLRVYKSIGRYDPKRRFSASIYAIARKTAAGYFRSRKPVDSLEEELLCATNEHPAAQLEREDDAERLWQSASRLKPRFHQVLLLHYAEGFSIAETSRIMGLTQVHTKVILHRARRQLSQRLQNSID